MENSFGLQWTGHPIIDMGVAACVIAINKKDPNEITEENWIELMDTLRKDYIDGIYYKPSILLFTLNAFENPSFKKNPENRFSLINETFDLVTFKTEPLTEFCQFFSDKPAVTRSARDQIPLVQGRNQINFYPHGKPEIPLSALALGCILALPLATPIVSGRLMMISSDDRELMVNICKAWYDELQPEYAKIRLSGGELSERKAPRTRLVSTLDELLGKDKSTNTKVRRYSGITLTHLTNTGNNPAIDIYTILPLINRFLFRSKSANYRPYWTALKATFWRKSGGRGGWQGEEPKDEDKKVFKNDLYEALPELPHTADRFIRRFMLSYVRNRVGIKNDFKTTNTNIWPIVELFIKEVMTMEKERIEKIKALADELASEINDNNDRRLYQGIMGLGSARGYTGFRQILIRALRARLKRENQLLFKLEDYLEIFEPGQEYPQADWSLARDLIRIRCLEKLFEVKFFEKEPDLLNQEEEEETELSEN